MDELFKAASVEATAMLIDDEQQSVPSVEDKSADDAVDVNTTDASSTTGGRMSHPVGSRKKTGGTDLMRPPSA